MPRAPYVPDRGELVWIDFQPRRGHEQSGHRPALVLSPRSYNRKTGLCVVCPATRQVKGYAFEVAHGDGVILSDHLRSIDWRARRARHIENVPEAVLEEVVAKIEALLIAP